MTITTSIRTLIMTFVTLWAGNSIELEAEDLWELEELKEYKYECPECEQTIYFRAEPTVNLYSKRESDKRNEAIEIY